MGDQCVQIRRSLKVMCSSCDYFWFGSVFTYKNNQTEILCNTKNKIKTESKLVQTEQFRFGYFI
jgi:hypothetical protein